MLTTMNLIKKFKTKEEKIAFVKEAYKATIRTFINLRRGEFTAQELTEILKEAHEEFEAKIIKGSNHEYEKYPLYPLLSNS